MATIKAGTYVGVENPSLNLTNPFYINFKTPDYNWDSFWVVSSGIYYSDMGVAYEPSTGWITYNTTVGEVSYRTIIIDSDQNTTDTEGYNWFTSNYKITPTEDTVYIKYNNETINSITKGQTCTLQCKSPEGKATQMLSDIDVEFVEGSGGDEPAPVGSPLRKILIAAGSFNTYTSKLVLEAHSTSGTYSIEFPFRTGGANEQEITFNIPMDDCILKLLDADKSFSSSVAATDCTYTFNGYREIVITNIALSQEGMSELHIAIL